jgi:hypothetical protein
MPNNKRAKSRENIDQIITERLLSDYAERWRPLMNRLSATDEPPTAAELQDLIAFWEDWPALWDHLREADDIDASVSLDLRSKAVTDILATAAEERGLDSWPLAEAYRLCHHVKADRPEVPLGRDWLNALIEAKEAFEEVETWQILRDARRTLDRLKAKLRAEPSAAPTGNDTEQAAEDATDTSKGFTFEGEGRALYDGEDLGLPAGETVNVLKRLVEAVPNTVPHATWSNKESEAPDEIRGAVSKINRALKAHEVPWTVRNVRGEGYRLCPS